MNQELPAIVIIAYNRADCLKRLLDSVKNAHYPDGVSLIISIDKSDITDVVQIANEFDWKYGPKRIIEQQLHLGLKEHVLRCGDLTEEYDSIIMLEDDLLVSPWFYEYAIVAKGFYQDDENIAGISLYKYQVTENYFYPFVPIDDGFDVHFMKLPCSWGQLFTKNHWQGFREWTKATGIESCSDKLPYYIASNWTSGSWKKHYLDYMIHTDKYFVYPNISFSTDYSDSGTNAVHKGIFQVPLATKKRNWTFVKKGESSLTYDSNFEVSPDYLKIFLPDFFDNDVTIDLFGTKQLFEINTKFVLSCKKCSKAVTTFGNELYPALQNIVYKQKGNFFSYGYKESFSDEVPERIHFYANYHAISDILKTSLNNYKIDEQAHSLFDDWLIKEQADLAKREEDFVFSFRLNQSCPKILHVALSAQELGAGPQKQNYPSSQSETLALAPDSSIEELVNHINCSNAEYYVITNQYEGLMDNVFSIANSIFQRYPDVLWITGSQTLTSQEGYQLKGQSLAARRWNKRIFEKNLYKNTGRYIPSGATFFRKQLWDLAKPHLNIISKETLFEDLCLAFFKVAKLYTADVYLSSAQLNEIPQVKNGITSSLVEDGWKKKFMEYFFHKNIPFLRSYYRIVNELPPVIRFDFKTQSYWLSEY